MANVLLIPLTEPEREKRRKLLLSTIKKRRSLLQKTVVKNEMLRVQLEILKREYTVKIGSLVVKDNRLDLDIIRARNIIRLMNEGKKYEEAAEELAQTYYAEQLEFELAEESIHEAEKLLEKTRLSESAEVQASSRKLWRKLISKFHPDLTQDKDEKKRREAIMIQINLAYEVGDLSKLESIERDNTRIEETTIEDLEVVLVLIENEIITQEKYYDDLKQSEWYAWNLKIRSSKKTIVDIFSHTEKNLLNDIVAKFAILRELQQQISMLEKVPVT